MADGTPSPDIMDRAGDEQALRLDEQALRLSEQRSRFALSRSPVVVWECDTDLRFTFVDNLQPPIADPDQIIGKRADEILPFESVRELIEVKKRVLATGVGERAELSVPAGNKVFHFEMVVDPIDDPNGTITGLRGLAIDISERKRTEEALRSVAAELQHTLHVAATGLTHSSRDFRYLSANTAFARYVGLPLDEIVGMPIVEVMGKPAFEIIRPRIERVLRGETVEYEDELPLVGGRKWIRAAYTPDRDVSGNVVGWFASVMDITDNKRREANSAFSAGMTAALSQLSTVAEIMQAFGSRLAAFLSVSSVTYWEIDEVRNEARLHCIWAAPEAAALQGFVRLADFLSDDLARATHEGTTAVVRDTETDARVDAMAWRAIKVRSIVVVPFLHEGRWKYSLNVFNSSPRDWREDEIDLIEELAHSMFSRVERARAEAALRDSEERYRGLAEQITDGIFVTDSEGRYVDANRAGCEMFGYTLEELKTLTVGDVIPADELQRLPEQFERLEGGQTVRNDWRFRRKDGSIFIGELVSRHLSNGRLQGVVRDVTEHKHVEAALRDEARRKDEFLALLGHELRNPLAALSTAMQVLSSGVSADRRAEFEGMMDRQLTLMQRLLDDLLDLGRITHGQIELKKEGIDLAEFLQKAAASMQQVVDNRRQTLLLGLPSESVLFAADRMRLEQIAANLLSNASKYTSPGGRIELSGSREGSEVVFRCKDNGQGISPEFQEKIFEPFTRVGPLTTGPGEASLGIGLALVKRLVELHRGTISVESSGPGMGSEFTVRLPLEPAPSDQPAAPEAKPVPTSRRARSVVVVEDNPDVAMGLVAALKQAGYQVSLFADAPSALAGLSSLKPHAILLDIGLPGIDGSELATELRKHRHLQHTPFIGLSGFSRPESGDFDHYFTKPVDLAALLTLLGAPGAGETATAHPMPQEVKILRVLLIDDHAQLSAATAALLRSEGLEVRTALSGKEGLEEAPDFKPELILCDLSLPDMQGLEVMRLVRSNPLTRHSYAVALTARSSAEIREFNREAERMDIDEFIAKPLTREAIRTLVTKVMRKQLV